MSNMFEKLRRANQPYRDSVAEEQRKQREREEAQRNLNRQREQARNNLASVYDQRVPIVRNLVTQFQVETTLQKVLDYISQTGEYRGGRLNLPKKNLARLFGEARTEYNYPLHMGDVVSPAQMHICSVDRQLAFAVGKEKPAQHPFYDDSIRIYPDLLSAKAALSHNVRHIAAVKWQSYHFDHHIRRGSGYQETIDTYPGIADEGVRVDIHSEGVVVAQFSFEQKSTEDPRRMYRYLFIPSRDFSVSLLEDAVASAYAGTIERAFAQKTVVDDHI